MIRDICDVRMVNYR